MKPALKEAVQAARDAEEEPAAQAARRLMDHEIDCLPVVRKVEEDPKRLQLIGRVSKTNFTRLLVELAEGKGGNYHS